MVLCMTGALSAGRGVWFSIAATGFTVAFLHAAIPTHWLPFVLTGRAQRWSRAKTLWVTALAGSGHVLFTTILGVVVVWAGIALNEKTGRLFPILAGSALILFGLFYVVRHFRGKGHGHHHLLGGHAHDEGHEHSHAAGVGPHGGVLLDTGHGLVEISVFETGVPPQFRLYFFDEAKITQKPEPALTALIETTRPGGGKQRFEFVREGNYLRSTRDIPEPHEFELTLALEHGGHVHSFTTKFEEEHDHGEHAGEAANRSEQEAGERKTSDRVAIGSLLALLTFSPCEGFLPVYLSGIKYGWFGFIFLSVILAVATVAGMVVFTWLTMAGVEKLRFKALEKYEGAVLGGLLCILGLLIIVFEH